MATPIETRDDFPDFGRDQTTTQAKHAGNIPTHLGGERPVTEQSGTLAGEYPDPDNIAVPYNLAGVTEAQATIVDRGENGTHARFAVGNAALAEATITQTHIDTHAPAVQEKKVSWFDEKKKRVIALVVAGVAVVAFAGFELSKGSSDKKEPFAGDPPVAAGNVNPSTTTVQGGINTETNTVTITTANVVPPNTAKESTPTSVSPSTKSEVSNLPSLEQKYQIDPTKAAADPDTYFANYAVSIGMKPGLLTSQQEDQLLKIVGDPNSNIQETGTLVNEVQGNNLTAIANALIVNDKVKLSPEETKAYHEALSKYILINYPTSSKDGGYYLMQSLKQYAQTAGQNRLVAIKVVTYSEAETVAPSGLPDRFIGCEFTPVDATSGKTLTDDVTNVQLHMNRGMIPGPISNGLLPPEATPNTDQLILG